jgi:CRP-like cAMP-binding protein
VDDSLSAIHGFHQIFLPTSRFRRWWDVITFLASAYYCFSIPVWIAVSFPPAESGGFIDNAGALIIAYLVDILFMIDVVFRYRFFFFMEDGIIVVDPDRIIKKFRAETSISYEIVCCIPWDIAAAILGAGYCPLLRVARLPRLMDLPRHLEKVERDVQQLFVYMSMPFKRLLNLNLAMYLLCHWVGCFFIFFGRLSQYWELENWIDSDASDSRFFIPKGEGKLPACLYLRAVYWAIVGMSTVGYGDIVPKSTPEMLFATIIILFGGLTVPAMVGGLAACVASLNQAQDQYRAKYSRVRELLKRKRYSPEQSSRVLRYYNYIWSRQGGIDEVSILNELPGPLRVRVCHSIAGDALQRISFFVGIPDNIINGIVSVLVPRVFVPGDEIMHAKEIGKEFYIIEKGRVHISSPNDVITYAVLGEGDCFGESCLLTKLRVRCSNVKCFSYCDCFELSKDDFNETMEAFPEQKETILLNVKRELDRKVKFNQNLTLNFQMHREKMLQKFDAFVLPETLEEAGGRIYSSSGWWESLRSRIAAPETAPREIWNVILLLAILYNAFAVPFRISFLTAPVTFIPDYVLDLLFILDMSLRLHCFGVEKEGKLITDGDQIRQSYLKGGFRRDLIASFPFEIILLLLRLGGADLGDHWPVVMACTRLPKVYRTSKLLELGRQLKISLAERFPQLPQTAMFLFQLLSGVVLVSHWAACGFITFARFKNYERSFNCNTDDFEKTSAFDRDLTMTARAQCIWQGTWISLQIEDGKLPAHGYAGPYASGTQYVRGLNWALPTLVVVVIGDVLPTTCLETLYVFICILLGMTVNAVIIGNIAGLVANLDTDSAAHNSKADALNAYMHHHHIPLHLQQRVVVYMRYVWNMHNGGTINEEFDTLSNLPVTLQQDLAVSSKLPFIKKCPFFDFCSDDVHRALATSLQSLRFSKGDVIVQYGDLGAEMYFLVSGEVEVVSADKATIYATLTSGAFFGEQALFFKQQRSATIRASDFCEILLLTKSSLDRELISREFDLTRMMKIFDGLKEANQRRNASLTANLKLSEDETSKLHKIVYPARMDSEESSKLNKHLKPGSLFRFFWDFLSLVLILYYACSLPFRAAYFYDMNTNEALKVLAFDFFVDLFFVVDIVLRLTIFPYKSDGGIVVTRAELIRRKYYDTSFVKDLVASFPLEILCAVPSVGVKQILVLRLVHMVRVSRLVEYLLLMEDYLTGWDFRISSSLTLIGRMFTIYILVNHCYACIWFSLHRLQAPHRNVTWALTSKMPLSEYDGETDSISICSNTVDGELITLVDCYNRAFYMVITTMSTVGYGDIYPTGNLETIWEIVVVLTGCSLFGSLVGSWQALFRQTDETGDNAFKEKMQRLMNYMQYRHFHTGLKNAIVLHYAHLWHSAKCLDEAAVVVDLPGPLRMEIAHFVVGRSFQKIPVIVECSALTKKRLADSMRKQIGAADTTIYEIGDIGWDIYFIFSGMVRVQLPERGDDSSDDEDDDQMGEDMFPPRLMARRRSIVLGELYCEGNHFGEGCLTSTSGVRVENVTTLAVVELFTISREKIENVLAYLPESRRQEFITHLLTRNGVVTHTFVTESQRNASKKIAQTLKVKGSIDSPVKRNSK